MASLKLHCCLSTLHDVRWSCLGGHHEMGKNCVQENWSVSLEPRCCSWKVGTRRDEESVTDIIKRMDAKPIYVCNVKVTKITLQPRIVRKWCSEDCLRLLDSFYVWTVAKESHNWPLMRCYEAEVTRSNPTHDHPIPKLAPDSGNFVVLLFWESSCCVALFKLGKYRKKQMRLHHQKLKGIVWWRLQRPVRRSFTEPLVFWAPEALGRRARQTNLTIRNMRSIKHVVTKTI